MLQIRNVLCLREDDVHPSSSIGSDMFQGRKRVGRGNAGDGGWGGGEGEDGMGTSLTLTD